MVTLAMPQNQQKRIILASLTEDEGGGKTTPPIIVSKQLVAIMIGYVRYCCPWARRDGVLAKSLASLAI